MSKQSPAALEDLKKAILGQRLKKRMETQPLQTPSSTIPLAERNGRLPLSWAQQRLWFLDQLDHAAGAAYHMPAALRLSGQLDKAALKKTLDRIVARHENLRTTFANQDGAPVQVIAPAHSGFALDEEDLGALESSAQEAALAERALTEARAPFDLDRGPLIRGRLLRLSEREHVLLMTQHHIISDGWSLGVLVREMTMLYAAFVEGRDDPLSELPIQYADYAVWQREWLQGSTLQRQVDFWRTHLQGAPALLELPTDRPRPPVQSFTGNRVDLNLTPELTRALQQLSQRHGTTLFMTLLGAWSMLLARLTGQDEVVIGTPVANRQRAQVEPLIGFFVNTLALRVRMDDDPSIAALLARIRAMTLEAYAHQDVPFEQVVEALQPARSLSYSPVFQTMFAFNNTPESGELRIPGLQLSTVGATRHTAHFDLELAMRETGDVVRGNIGYASDLFDHATVERYAGYFVRLLEAMVVDVSLPVSRLPLLPGAERQRVLVDFNATDTQAQSDASSLQALVEAQVQRQPDAPAVSFEGATLSYAELNRRANQVAHRLIALGVKPNDRVAICVERSLELVVGVLGIVKAGAGYVPLDPAYPQERLRYMLDDSDAKALLSQAALLESVPVLAEHARVLRMDDAQLSAQSERDPAVVGVTPNHLAYVIYTSGSTGLPKGVAMPQGPLLNLLEWQRGLEKAPANERVLQFSALGFDVAFQEIFYTLSSGGCLMLIRETVRQDPFALVQHIKQAEVQRIFLPFVAFQGLVAAAEQSGESLPTLMHVVTAGEQLFVTPAIRAFFARVPGRLLHNQYGPTETHVATAHTLPAAPETWGTTPPIGRPIANSQAYVLDAKGQPVPIGVTGELFLAGTCVARGYLNRAELTAERFLRDPFASRADARMYKTGDLARWLPNGELEYLGRNDFQVKIRGFRVELGEIEAKLSSCAGVREAVVMAREDGTGGKRLVAYVLPQAGMSPTAAELREALSHQLAEYMVPSAFVTLDTWPLTPNGKLDRRALPAPDQSAIAARAYEAPEGEFESTIADIWRQLLGLERVGRWDHFFELGGHSLMAVQLVTHLRERLHVEVALREIFAQPTVAGLAQSLVQHERVAVAKIPLADRNAPLPLSWAQQRLWFIDQLDAAAGAAYHLPAALRLRGTLNRDALKTTLDRIVARHEALRTSFASVEGEPVQVIAPARTGFALAEIDLTALDVPSREAAVAEQGRREAREPFDLSRGPLIRGRLLRLSDSEHVLLLTQHHIISDGWSLGVLIREVTTLYTVFVEGREDPLPALPIQYADYAVWQRDWLQATASKQLDFWRAHLKGAPALLELPTDRPRPAVQSHAGAHVPVTIPAELARQLHDLSKRHGATLFMTLMAAWASVLTRLSGQQEVVIGTPVANRQRLELEPLIGFFVNTLALRVSLADKPTVAGLLAQIKASTLEAYANQDVPFEQVVEAVQPARSLSHSPLFQTVLALNNTPEGGELVVPGLTLGPVPGERHTSHFDLELSLTDNGERISGALSFATALFDRDRIERVGEYFLRTLEAMVADQQQPANRIDLLSARERDQVLVAFNATQADYARDSTISQAFEALARNAPDAPALSGDGMTLSYAELNRQANRLAHHLIALGVKPDDRVAVCAERSPELLVAFLGILKAGGGYVPLDPTYPAARLRFMLEDSAPAVLLTQADLRTMLEPIAPGVPLCLLDDAQLASQADTNPVVAGLGPRHLAYVIYTSGSTGQPKGVMVEHRNVLRLVLNNPFAPVGVGDCIGHCANPAFDASTWEVWGALLNGARVHVVAPSVVLEAEAFAHELIASGVTALWLTVGLFNEYADTLAPAFARLKHLLVGGDALDPRKIARALSRAERPARLVNGYGPTETTTFAVTHQIDSVSESAHGIPIGRPIANTQIYLLDPLGQPVPIGVTGEVYIGGDGVARGYLNRPELTAERFLRDPFTAAPDARMYRTGDLGRWRSDGVIEYLGRNDFQVKIRGFRIELGEIEARLATCPGVREAVVLAREDDAKGKHLVAYIIPQAGAALGAAELREALARDLADYMVPGAFVMLDAWPLTANGKLDRAALPAPDEAAAALRSYEAPDGVTESAIAEVWQSLLGLERVGRHDRFFELGGHSLLAIRMAHALEQRLGVRLPLSAIFAAPSVAALASVVSQEKSPHADPSALLLPLQTEAPGHPLFCLHPIGGQATVYHALALQLADTCPVYGVQAVELVGGVSPDSLEAITTLQTEAIRARQPRGPYRLLGWSTGGLFAAAVAERLTAEGEGVEYLGLLDTHPISPVAARNPEVRAGIALRAEMGARGLSVGREWVDAFLAEGKSVAALIRMPMREAQIYADLTGLQGMEPALLEHLQAQLPITIDHLERLTELQPLALEVPVQRIWAAGPESASRAPFVSTTKREAARTIAAGHHAMLKDPHAREVASAIADFLQSDMEDDDVPLAVVASQAVEVTA
ncbi:amino acid adenylation domain-containing protein [Lysobacter tyrosinilyticus]